MQNRFFLASFWKRRRTYGALFLYAFILSPDWNMKARLSLMMIFLYFIGPIFLTEKWVGSSWISLLPLTAWELILSIENLSIFGQYPKTTRQTLNILSIQTTTFQSRVIPSQSSHRAPDTQTTHFCTCNALRTTHYALRTKWKLHTVSTYEPPLNGTTFVPYK